MFPYKKDIIFVLLLISFALPSSGQDPCLEANYQHLQDLPKRSPLYARDSTPLCDRYITETWYRTKYHVMSSSPPSLLSCGTLYPVWLRGSTPSEGVTIDMTACEVGFGNDCERQYTVAVKNCTEFLVYKLKPLVACNSAYCFENGDECVKESLDGISVSFHNIAWEKYDYPNLGLVSYEPFINLLCSFTPSDDDTLLYHIDWYVDNDAVIQGQTVDKTSLQDAILSAEDMINAGKKINSWIHCVVGAKAARDKSPCLSESSELFFAGIEILNTPVTLERMGNAEIMFRPTIPFASRTVDDGVSLTTSDLSVELSFPDNIRQECTRGGEISDCEKNIKSFTYEERQKYDDQANWYKVYTITLYNSDAQNYYLQDKNFILRLKTNAANGNGAQIFSEVALHDININLVEKENAWKGKRCSSYADPHQTTFDGYQYECQDNGCITGKTYIFYRNEDFLQEVQVRHDNCWGRPRCVCAVAARAGKDVFTIDVCSGTKYINFPICSDNSLKVIKEYDHLYTVLFPTGTSVKIVLYNYGVWFINLEVYPSVLDVSRTSGLCGFLDGIITNDLRREDGTEDDIGSFDYRNRHPNEFSLSWQSADADDLLAMSQTVYNQLGSLDRVNQHCLCDNKKISCSHKYSGCTATNRGKEYFCVLHTSSRRKREILTSSSSKKHTDKVEELTRIKRQTFSEVEAFAACNDAFQRSTYYDACLKNIPNFSNETIVNCISDLTVTGDQNLTQLHLDTALGQCQQYILLNSTLQDENPNITTIIVNLCPNNCSNRGVCSSGNCTCEYGFGGSDCSFDVLSPPTITMISGDGICDISEEECSDITLYGYYFFENMGTTCHVTREQINGSNIVLSRTSYSVKLEERTLFEGYCSLQYAPESTWTTKFTFTLSNDNYHYSKNYSVHVYQSNCQTYHNDSGDINFTIQSGYCFINGSCVLSGTMKSNNSCWQCNPHFDVHDWTWDCNSTNTPDTSTLPSTTIADVPHSSLSSTAAAVTTTELPVTPTGRTEIAEETTSLNGVSSSTNPTTESASSKSPTNSSTSPTSSTTSEISSKTSQSSSISSTTSLNGVSSSTNPTTESASSKSPTSSSTSPTSSTTSEISSTTSQSSSISSTMSGTLTTLKKSESDKSNTPNDQNKKLSSEVTGLIIAVTIVSFVIIVTAVIMIRKWIQGKKKENSSVNSNIEDEVCKIPDTTTFMSTKGNFNPEDLFHFQSNEKYSRPPSATSTRAMPPTNDLSKFYDKKHIDKLFSVTK